MSEGIPEGWEIKTIKDCIEQFKNGYAFSSSGYVASGIPIISIVNISLEGKFKFDEAREKKWSIDDSKKLNGFKVYDGDLIIAMTDVTPGMDMIGRGAIVKRNIISLLNQRVGLIKTKIDLDKTYLAYFLNGNRWRKTAKRSASLGAQANLGTADILSSSILLPPLPEQKKIASILTSVDEVIESTQKQIDKLQDLKKATMNELLTKGIGHTEFKDTELGRIPKSWKLGLVGEYSSLVTNGFVGSAVQHYRSEGIPYLVSKNIRDNYIDERGLTYISKEFHEKTTKSQLKIGDLLTVQSGHVGSSAVVSQKFNGANCHALILTRFDHNLIKSDFVAYYFNSQIGRLRLSNYFVGSTIVHLNTSDLKRFKFPIPNLSEQVEVVTIIKSIERQISFWNNKLTHTKYLKKSLMQDLLTGKVRVSVN
jgi:type I restriction enzyme, S subunit